MYPISKKVALTAVAGSAALVIAACGSSSSCGSSGSGSSSAVPKLSLGQINNTFSAMTTLKPLAAKGKGNVTVILPDTVRPPGTSSSTPRT